MKIVKSYSTHWEAELGRTKLEAAGINATVVDSNTVRINWLYSNAIGGVKIAVDEQFAPKALELLAQTTEHLDERAEFITPCPVCASEDTGLAKWLSPTSVLLSLLNLLPFFVPRHRMACISCGHMWEP